MSSVAHGTVSAYTNRGCRCGPCRAASAAYKREQRKLEEIEQVDRELLGRLLDELCPDGLTDDCPYRRGVRG
jgi:hypothetical protein